MPTVAGFSTMGGGTSRAVFWPASRSGVGAGEWGLLDALVDRSGVSLAGRSAALTTLGSTGGAPAEGAVAGSTARRNAWAGAASPSSTSERPSDRSSMSRPVSAMRFLGWMDSFLAREGAPCGPAAEIAFAVVGLMGVGGGSAGAGALGDGDGSADSEDGFSELPTAMLD